MSGPAEWISALGALGALIAAIWAARTSKNLFDIESRRDDDAAQRAEREQASQISAWCIASVDENGDVLQRGLLIHNSSPAPVYELEVASTYSVSKAQGPVAKNPFRMGILPPGDFTAWSTSDFDGWSFPLPSDAAGGTIQPITKNPAWAVQSVAFRDSYGLIWVRSGGSLQRLA